MNINLYLPPTVREKKKGKNEEGFMCQVMSAADARTTPHTHTRRDTASERMKPFAYGVT